MVEDSAISPEEIRRIAERAIILERYILKRMWGLFYAVWAIELSIVFYLPLVIQLLGFSADFELIARIVINTSVNLVCLVVTLRVFKRAYDTFLIRKAITNIRWVELLKPKWAILLWTAYYALSIIAIIFFRPNAVAVMFGLQITTIPSLYYCLKASFPEELPIESVVALSFYGISITASFAISLLGVNPTAYRFLWGLTIIVFILASMHSRSEKPPLLKENSANW